MNKELTLKCIESLKQMDKLCFSDCEEENVISISSSSIQIMILAAIRDAYYAGYSSNKDISLKEEFSSEEMNHFNELTKKCVAEIIELDKKTFPDVVDAEPVVSVDVLYNPILNILDVAFKNGQDVQE